MSLTFHQMQMLMLEIKPILEGLPCTHFFVLTSRKFILAFQGSTRNHYLLLSLQENFLRFHLFNGKFKKEEQAFAQKMDRILADAFLQDLSLLNEDRILSLSFSHGKSAYRLVAEFFPKKSNLYLLDDQDRILETLSPSPLNTLYLLPEKPLRLSQEKDESGSLNSEEVEKQYREKEKLAEFLGRRNQVHSHLSKLLKHAQKQLQQTEKQLLVCQNWEQVQHEGVLLQANLYRISKGSSSITVSDWEQDGAERSIVLNPLEEPVEQAAHLFLRAKKLKLGLKHMQERIIRLQKQVENHHQLLQSLEGLNSSNELEAFSRSIHLVGGASKREPRQSPSQPYHEFMTASGLKIWVGKSGKQNEWVTFNLARGLDYWFHVADYSGAHVILRCPKGQDPDPDSIKDALQLALRYSKGKDKGESDVYYTQCKYVTKSGKNEPGKVQISKHKVLHAKLDAERWQNIQKRG